MGSIFILDNHPNRRQRLARYLSDAGHVVYSMEDPEEMTNGVCIKCDLGVVNLYPDATRTWDFYRKFKEQYPKIPVVVYLENSFDAFRSLKQVIALILGETPAPGQCLLCRSQDGRSSYANRPSAGQFERPYGAVG